MGNKIARVEIPLQKQERDTSQPMGNKRARKDPSLRPEKAAEKDPAVVITLPRMRGL